MKKWIIGIIAAIGGLCATYLIGRVTATRDNDGVVELGVDSDLGGVRLGLQRDRDGASISRAGTGRVKRGASTVGSGASSIRAGVARGRRASERFRAYIASLPETDGDADQ